jgi:FMN-dependent oxidoreductase (nitrilotriacetate monooxygenase family)
MSSRGQLHLSAFDMACAGHQSPGLWRHPEDQSHRYTDLRYWTGLARTLERGCFDSLFLGDALGVHDVYRSSAEAALRNGAQVPVNDPMLAVSAMAAVTEHLGFAVTVSPGYEQPYALARKFSTLDHLTGGRVGWNIGTTYPDSAARNLALGLSCDERYEAAGEFLEVCYKLWESSWEDGAVVRDRRCGVFADPRKVHPVEHKGTYFTVPGIHLSEPSPQRTPVLFGADASVRGRRLAAAHAEVVVMTGARPDLLRPEIARVRRLAEAEGRDPAGITFLALMTVITAATDEEARAKHRDYQRYASYDGALALYGGWSGLDLSGFGLDEPLRHAETEEVRGAVEAFTRADPGREWTPREVARWVSVGGLGPVVVGGPRTVADEMERWMAEAGVDGFSLGYAIKPGTFCDVVEHLVPELQRRELLRAGYEGGTLRESFRGKGQTLLPDDHPGSWFRRPASLRAHCDAWRGEEPGNRLANGWAK